MKKALAVLVILLSIIIIFSFISGGSNNPEKVATQFLENMFDGNAKKAVSFLSDEAIENSGFASRKVLISKLQDSMDEVKKAAKSKYGNNWKFKVVVIDLIERQPEYDEEGNENSEQIVDAYMRVEHSGKKKDGKEDITLTLKKEGKKWMVASFGTQFW